MKSDIWVPTARYHVYIQHMDFVVDCFVFVIKVNVIISMDVTQVRFLFFFDTYSLIKDAVRGIIVITFASDLSFGAVWKRQTYDNCNFHIKKEQCSKHFNLI